MKKVVIGFIAAGLLLCNSFGVVEATTTNYYNITNLGEGIALSINNNGQVLGRFSNGPTSFLWDPSLGIQIVNHQLNDINNNGIAVGEKYAAGSGGITWDSNTGITHDLGTIDGNPIRPTVINNNGVAIGNNYGPTNGFKWDIINGIKSLVGITEAKDINDAGIIVGGGYYGSPVASIWDEINGAQRIGVFNDGDSSIANAINNLNQVVGNSEFSSTTESHHAFLWDENNGMIDLGTLGYRPYQSDFSAAYDINNLGQVVGTSSAISSTDPSGEGGHRGFVWDDVYGMRDLNSLILYDTGWVLGRAFSINDLGQIVGAGMYKGERYAYLLSLNPDYVAPVTEPVPILLMGTGLVGLVGVRRKKKV